MPSATVWKAPYYLLPDELKKEVKPLEIVTLQRLVFGACGYITSLGAPTAFDTTAAFLLFIPSAAGAWPFMQYVCIVTWTVALAYLTCCYRTQTAL